MRHIKWKTKTTSINRIFFSESNNEEITDVEITDAQREWNKFNINNLGEYQHLYNIT